VKTAGHREGIARDLRSANLLFDREP